MNKQDDGAATTGMPTAAELLAATEAEAPSALGGAAGAAAKSGRPGGRQGAQATGEKGGGLAAFGAAVGLVESPNARALREAADAEPGVRSRSCLIRTDEDTGATTVIVSIAVAYGLALHAVADRVREHVAVAAVDVLGIEAPAKKAAKSAAKPASKAASKPSARTAKAKAKAAQADGRLRVDVKVVWLDEPAPNT